MTVEDLKEIAFKEALSAADAWRNANQQNDSASVIRFRAIIDTQIRWLAVFEELEA